MSGRIVMIDGPARGKAFAIDKAVVTIGRAVDVDVVLGGVGVSRRHAEIRRDGIGYKVVDTESRCGTILNQHPIREAPLKNGDEIVIGRVRLKFLNDLDTATESSADDPVDELVSSLHVSSQRNAPGASTPEATLKSNLRLKALLEMATDLQGPHALNELLNLILERIFIILRAERAYVLLVDPASGDVRLAAFKSKDGSAPDPDRLPVSRTICQRVIRSREAVITTDAASDQRFKSGVSVHDFSIRSAMCAPMAHKDRVVGLIHVDTKGLAKCFSNDDLELLVAAASTAAASVANTLLSQEIQRHERVRENLSRFFSPSVVDEVTRSDGIDRLRGERVRMSVLFTDIREFTSMSQSMAPEAVVALLNRFFSMAVTHLFRQSGTLDKFLGDGLMAIFGAPVPLKNSAANAVRAAMEIVTATQTLNSVLAAEHVPALKLGVAVTTGYAIVGTIGSPERVEYTAIGSPVNLAARLVAVAAPGQILIDEATADALGKDFNLNDLGHISVKGFSAQVRYFQVNLANPADAPQSA